jgi:hypothetical protein
MGIIVGMATISVSGAIASKILNSWGKSDHAQLVDTITTGTIISTAIGIAVKTLSELRKLG